MLNFKEYKELNEGLTPVQNAAGTVQINARQQIAFDEYAMEGIAVIGQRGVNHERVILPLQLGDKDEFETGLRPEETLHRISSVGSKPGTNAFRPIVKIDAVRGKIAFIKEELYADTGEVKWERPLKFRFLNIDDAQIKLFGLKY